MSNTTPTRWTQEWIAQFTHHHDSLEADLVRRARTTSREDMTLILGNLLDSQVFAKEHDDDRRATDMEFAIYGLTHLMQMAYVDDEGSDDA